MRKKVSVVKCHKSVSWQIVFYDIQISGLFGKNRWYNTFWSFCKTSHFQLFWIDHYYCCGGGAVLLCNHFRRQRPRTSKLGKENCSSGSKFYRTITKRIKRTSAAKKFDPISQGPCARLFSQNCTLLLKIPSIDDNVAQWFENV